MLHYLERTFPRSPGHFLTLPLSLSLSSPPLKIPPGIEELISHRERVDSLAKILVFLFRGKSGHKNFQFHLSWKWREVCVRWLIFFLLV